MKLPQNIIDNIEKKVGLSINKINSLNPIEISQIISKKLNKSLNFKSEFPFIGRGNILRDDIQSTVNINKEIDKILGLL
jgi:hypothetical protein